VCWTGSGFEEVAGGSDETRTAGETRKLDDRQLKDEDMTPRIS
jgi:hypothetical protein